MGDKLVYSTDPDYCGTCGKSPCVCGQKNKSGKQRQPKPVIISFRRGAKGSGMTHVEGIVMHPSLKEKLLKRFKKRLGCGGTIKGGTIELQGDRRDFVQADLEADGYRVKRSGGN